MWWNPERFAVGSVTVGCPPDFYNQQGQDWGQPPFNPNYLNHGYGVYREMVHNMFSHAGAVRIDHVLGLFRLWWIPQGEGARGGAYVTYDYEAMIAILTIEASRVNGLVVGEDLGTVPDYVRTVLAEHGLLGCTVEWFARVDDSPNAGDPYADPADYREYALASVTTHDLPPTAGYLQFEHVRLREELNLLTGPVEKFQASATAERQAMLDRLVESELITPEIAADATTIFKRSSRRCTRCCSARHPCFCRRRWWTASAKPVRRTSRARPANTATGACHWQVPTTRRCTPTKCSTCLA